MPWEVSTDSSDSSDEEKKKRAAEKKKLDEEKMQRKKADDARKAKEQAHPDDHKHAIKRRCLEIGLKQEDWAFPDKIMKYCGANC
jgi:hypothetical protein